MSLLAAAVLMLTLPPRSFGTDGAPLTYLVMGDSTAAGVGADYEQGIAISTARALGESRRVTMVNAGVSGAKMGDVLREQLPTVASLKPDLVLLSVGANDVIRLTPRGSIRRDLLAVVAQLKRANPEVRIVVTGSPDMGSPPRIPRLLRPIAGCRSKQVNRTFREVAKQEGLTFAPIAEETGPLFRADRSLFHPDRFHPNEAGYAVWTKVLVRALKK